VNHVAISALQEIEWRIELKVLKHVEVPLLVR